MTDLSRSSSTSETTPAAPARENTTLDNPWPALWALCLGFFMILLDTTIVAVGTPAIMNGLHADLGAVVWVTSAYLLAYAVPLLVSGRLGDRYGPKNVYLVGLAVFTLASLWCGLTGSIEGLIAARVLQGLGAAAMSPQTMAVITRIFPGETRGTAMGLWGSVAGVATLVGPILGGVLIDHVGWEWIFFINIPVGIIAFVMALKLVPSLPVHTHTFDWIGVLLSGIGMFLLVFGLQEGNRYDWGTITGVISVPLLIVAGIAVLVAFVVWQRLTRAEPLIPLVLFTFRNFSLANVAIFGVGLAITAMNFPIMVWAQSVRGWTPTQAALLMAPTAVLTLGLAPVAGRLVNRMHPRLIAGFGLTCFAVGIVWYGLALHSDTPWWQLVAPALVLGLANAFMWAPISVTATRTLPPARAGAGSGVFNATRQLGAVLGSAAIAALMESRLASHLGGYSMPAGEAGAGARVPAVAAESFSRAMGESLYLPAAVVAVGVVAVLFFVNPHQAERR